MLEAKFTKGDLGDIAIDDIEVVLLMDGNAITYVNGSIIRYGVYNPKDIKQQLKSVVNRDYM